jgi:hypothetical protein
MYSTIDTNPMAASNVADNNSLGKNITVLAMYKYNP